MMAEKTITLLIKMDTLHCVNLMVDFIIVILLFVYDAIFGRSTLGATQVVCNSHYL